MVIIFEYVLKTDAEKEGLLDKAKSNGEKTLKDFYKLFGFEEVIISHIGEVERTPRLKDVESKKY